MKYCSSQGRSHETVVGHAEAWSKYQNCLQQGGAILLSAPDYLFDVHSAFPSRNHSRIYFSDFSLWPVINARAEATLMPRMMRFDHSRRTPTPSPLVSPASPTLSRSNTTALSWLKLEKLGPTWLLSFPLRSTFACLGLDNIRSEWWSGQCTMGNQADTVQKFSWLWKPFL